LVFTRYCHCQYCMVYGIHEGGRVGGRMLPNSRAIVLRQCGQCRRAGRMNGRWIRAHTTRSKRISRKGQGGDRPNPPSSAHTPLSYLAFTRYSFSLGLLCTNQPSCYCPHPPALPALLQYYCTTIAQCTTPPRLPCCMPYTIQYW